MTAWNNRQLLGKVKDSARSTDPITGTTDNFLTSVVDLDIRQNRDTELIIENTGGFSLYYEIAVRNEYTEEINFTVFSNVVADGDSDEILLVRHARVFVYVKSHNLGDHTEFSITGIGGT